MAEPVVIQRLRLPCTHRLPFSWQPKPRKVTSSFIRSSFCTLSPKAPLKHLVPCIEVSHRNDSMQLFPHDGAHPRPQTCQRYFWPGGFLRTGRWTGSWRVESRTTSPPASASTSISTGRSLWREGDFQNKSQALCSAPIVLFQIWVNWLSPTPLGQVFQHCTNHRLQEQLWEGICWPVLRWEQLWTEKSCMVHTF